MPPRRDAAAGRTRQQRPSAECARVVAVPVDQPHHRPSPQVAQLERLPSAKGVLRHLALYGLLAVGIGPGPGDDGISTAEQASARNCGVKSARLCRAIAGMWGRQSMKHSRSPLGLVCSHNLRRVNRQCTVFGPLHPRCFRVIAGCNNVSVRFATDFNAIFFDSCLSANLNAAVFNNFNQIDRDNFSRAMIFPCFQPDHLFRY